MSTEALNAIRNLLGVGGYIDDASAMEPYLTSMRNRHIVTSPLIALPSTTQHVAEIVKICRRYRQPIVPQGGNTGLVDGGIPMTQGQEIVVNLSRMNKIRALDPIGSIMTVEAGAILKNVQDAAADAGFLFPLSMASEGSMQIGGAIGTNAGGTAVLRYGTMRNLVLGIEAVLPNGSVVSSLKKLVKDNTGYNLSQMLIGSEGTLGIVTVATLRLFPALRQSFTTVVAVPSAKAALDLFGAFRREGAEVLTSFEIMSLAALRLVMKHIPGVRFPGQDGAPYYLLIELGASSSAVPLSAMFENVATAGIEKGQILDAVIAESAAQARQFWHVREHIPEALRKQGNRIHFDIALPLEEIADFLVSTETLIKAEAPDIVPMPFGHIGDGNLHYNMYATGVRSAEDFAVLKARIQVIVFGEVDRRQGSISAEHGIGLERKAVLASIKSPIELELMRRIKRALDPDGIMNPGKIFD